MDAEIADWTKYENLYEWRKNLLLALYRGEEIYTYEVNDFIPDIRRWYKRIPQESAYSFFLNRYQRQELRYLVKEEVLTLEPGNIEERHLRLTVNGRCIAHRFENGSTSYLHVDLARDEIIEKQTCLLQQVISLCEQLQKSNLYEITRVWAVDNYHFGLFMNEIPVPESYPKLVHIIISRKDLETLSAEDIARNIWGHNFPSPWLL